MTVWLTQTPSSTNSTKPLRCWGASPGRREELDTGIQSFPHGRYILFYRAVPGVIEIVRVLHSARDIENIFDDQR
jgi:hypothetical protein